MNGSFPIHDGGRKNQKKQKYFTRLCLSFLDVVNLDQKGVDVQSKVDELEMIDCAASTHG
ncbi:MAG: hypothetical protein WAM14_06150 [Candidatus Nitrosopolaris sp.]